MTEYDICNNALAYIGNTETIASFIENTTASALCGRLYPIEYKNLLEEYPWSFAVKTADLVEITDETSDIYSFVYEYPTDCLRLLRILPADESYVNEYEIQYVLDGTTDAKRILCNVDTAGVEYIADIDNPVMFTPSFAEALAWRLAIKLAIPLSSNASTIQMAQQFAQAAEHKAKLLNAKQQKKEVIGSKKSSLDARW